MQGRPGRGGGGIQTYLRRDEEQEGGPPLERVVAVHHHFLLFHACSARSGRRLPPRGPGGARENKERAHIAGWQGRAPSGTLVDPFGMTGSLTTWNLGASPYPSSRPAIKPPVQTQAPAEGDTIRLERPIMSRKRKRQCLHTTCVRGCQATHHTDVTGVVDGGVLANAQPQLEQHDARYVYQLLRAALEVPVLPQVSGQCACTAATAAPSRARMTLVGLRREFQKLCEARA